MKNLCCQHLNNSWFPSLEHCGEKSSVFRVTASLSPYYKATNQWCQLRNLPYWPKDIARYTKYADSVHIVGLHSGRAILSSIGSITIAITRIMSLGWAESSLKHAAPNTGSRHAVVRWPTGWTTFFVLPRVSTSTYCCYVHQGPKQNRRYSLWTWMWCLLKMGIF